MKRLGTILLMIAASACSQRPAPRDPLPHDWRDEVIYHVLPRSFHDADGDRHGDLRGLTEKLPYLKELGVTAILALPLFESEFYHNYFPTDYERIDTEYGTMDDYLAFVRAVHANGMRFIMDMETQYVATGHPWLDDSWKNPASPYSDYLAWTDSLNEHALGVYGIDTSQPVLPHWPDRQTAIVALDLANPTIRDWTGDLFAFWADPTRDGDLTDGVDGFRIDHIMDDLDNTGRSTNLYADLWKPTFERARAVNPSLFVVGEQANWAEFGDDMMARSGADAAFGFPVRAAITTTVSEPFAGEHVAEGTRPLVPDSIARRVSEALGHLPLGQGMITFIENHDTSRFASVVDEDPGMIRAGAVLNLTLPGIPSIYYGQELGIPGVQGSWGHDGNDIPIREAFPWTPDPDTPGTAVWYRDTGPWWDGSYFLSQRIGALALSAQHDDPSSVWNLYRRLIALRRERVEWRRGDFRALENGRAGVLVFERTLNGARTVVIMNLSSENVDPETASLGIEGYAAPLGTAPGQATHLLLEPWAWSILVSPE